MSKSSTRSLRATLFLVALLLGTAATASATTYTVAPAADAFVYQASPNTNYGLDPYLLIRHTATGQGVFSFLRFNVPTLDGPVVSATLRMRVSGTLQEVGYYHVSMGVPYWSESWLTWNNWLSGSSYSYLGSHYWVPANTFLDLDVTGWVSGSTVTFAVASSVDSFGQHFYSKDFGGTAYDPVLILETLPPECGVTGHVQGDPADLLNELLCVMKGNSPQSSSWQARVDPDFSEWNGASENKAVIAGAIALYEGPVYAGTDYRTWWIDFLGRQASAPGSPTGTGNSRFFKGSELFSNIYDSDTTTGVMGAHLWALTHPSDPQATTLKNLAKDYLRRTFFAWGLTASLPDFQRVYTVDGTTYSLVQSASYNCPVLAMASPRSRTAFAQDSKRWMLGKAVGLAASCYKHPQVRNAVDYMASQNGSVFGLSPTEATQIRNLVNSTSIPGSIGSILGAVRLRTDFHFLLWNDGRRATFWIGGQLNNNVSSAKGTVFTAFYDRGTRNLDLLYATGTGNSTCLDEPNERVHVGACGSTHYLELPDDPPTYHYVLGPNGWRSCSNLSCS